MQHGVRCLKYTIKPAPEYSTERLTVIWLSCNAFTWFVYLRLSYPSKAPEGNILWYCALRGWSKDLSRPKRHIYYAEEGCIRLEMEIHGLNPEMSARRV